MAQVTPRPRHDTTTWQPTASCEFPRVTCRAPPSRLPAACRPPPAHPRRARGLWAVPIVLALVLLVALGVTLAHSEPRLTGTNSVPLRAPEDRAAAGRSSCARARQLMPEGSGRMRMFIAPGDLGGTPRALDDDPAPSRTAWSRARAGRWTPRARRDSSWQDGLHDRPARAPHPPRRRRVHPQHRSPADRALRASSRRSASVIHRTQEARHRADDAVVRAGEQDVAVGARGDRPARRARAHRRDLGVLGRVRCCCWRRSALAADHRDPREHAMRGIPRRGLAVRARRVPQRGRVVARGRRRCSRRTSPCTSTTCSTSRRPARCRARGRGGPSPRRSWSSRRACSAPTSSRTSSAGRCGRRRRRSGCATRSTSARAAVGGGGDAGVGGYPPLYYAALVVPYKLASWAGGDAARPAQRDAARLGAARRRSRCCS